MARKKENPDAMAGLDFGTEEAATTRKMNPNSLANLKTREPGTAKPKAYMQLNIYDYEDYIYRMSKVNNKSMTQYVLDLIEADMKANNQAYDGLKMLKSLDKPARVTKNHSKKSK